MPIGAIVVLASALYVAAGDFIDCVGQVLTNADCASADLGYTTCEEWLGDDSCDNGFTLTDSDIQMFLNCPKYANDDGDCDEGGDFTCMEESMTDECEAAGSDEIVDCWGQVLRDSDCAVESLGYTKCTDWLSDGSCDGGQHLSDMDIMINFNCEDFDWDGQDCLAGTFGMSRSPTTSPTLTPTTAPSLAPTKPPTKQPSQAPTTTPTVTPTHDPTTASPTFAPTPDCWRTPENCDTTEDPIDTAQLEWSKSMFMSEGLIYQDDSMVGDGLTIIDRSPPQGWIRVESGNPATASKDIPCGGDSYGAGLLTGFFWAPVGTGALKITVNAENGPAWIWINGKQAAGVMEGVTAFEVSSLLEAVVPGQWNKIQAAVISPCGVGSLEFTDAEMTPECINEKGDEICQYWAQIPTLCEDPDIMAHCKKTCRDQSTCVLPIAPEERGMYPFESNSFSGAAGMGDDGTARGDVTIAEDLVHGGVLEVNLPRGDVLTNMEENIPLSICAWFKPTDSELEMTIVDSSTDEQCGSGVIAMGIMLNEGANPDTGYMNIYGYNGVIRPEQKYVADEWQHVCTVWTQTTIEMYYNGRKVVSTENVLPDTTTGGKFSIGTRCISDETGNHVGEAVFTGQIDDVGFYNLALKQHEVSVIYTATADTGVVFTVDTRVSVNWEGKGDWFSGTISAVNEANLGEGTEETYDIIYDDGDQETQVTRSYIKLLVNESRLSGFRLRETVRVNRFNLGENHEALIRILQANGKYTVEYTDGTVETNVPADRISPVVKFVRGAAVRAKQCFWYDGMVSDVNPDGTYLIAFQDGSDYFANVDFADLQKQSQKIFTMGQRVLLTNLDGTHEEGYIIHTDVDEDKYGVGTDAGHIEWGVRSARLSACTGACQ